MLTGEVSALTQNQVDSQLTMTISVLVVETMVILSVVEFVEVKLRNWNSWGITDFWDCAVTFSQLSSAILV